MQMTGVQQEKEQLRLDVRPTRVFKVRMYGQRDRPEIHLARVTVPAGVSSHTAKHRDLESPIACCRRI